MLRVKAELECHKQRTNFISCVVFLFSLLQRKREKMFKSRLVDNKNRTNFITESIKVGNGYVFSFLACVKKDPFILAAFLFMWKRISKIVYLQNKHVYFFLNWENFVEKSLMLVRKYIEVSNKFCKIFTWNFFF